LIACNRIHDISAEPLHFHVSGLVATSVHHLHPQDITLAMFQIIGIEVDTAAAGNDEAAGWLCLD
jgi:hypothetical protein